MRGVSLIIKISLDICQNIFTIRGVYVTFSYIINMAFEKPFGNS